MENKIEVIGEHFIITYLRIAQKLYHRLDKIPQKADFDFVKKYSLNRPFGDRVANENLTLGVLDIMKEEYPNAYKEFITTSEASKDAIKVSLESLQFPLQDNDLMKLESIVLATLLDFNKIFVYFTKNKRQRRNLSILFSKAYIFDVITPVVDSITQGNLMLFFQKSIFKSKSIVDEFYFNIKLTFTMSIERPEKVDRFRTLLGSEKAENIYLQVLVLNLKSLNDLKGVLRAVSLMRDEICNGTRSESDFNFIKAILKVIAEKIELKIFSMRDLKKALNFAEVASRMISGITNSDELIEVNTLEKEMETLLPAKKITLKPHIPSLKMGFLKKKEKQTSVSAKEKTHSQNRKNLRKIVSAPNGLVVSPRHRRHPASPLNGEQAPASSRRVSPFWDKDAGKRILEEDRLPSSEEPELPSCSSLERK